MPYTKEQIQEMRDWIADCQWPDLEPEEIDQLTDDEIIKGVKKHYSGGLEQFIADGNPA